MLEREGKDARLSSHQLRIMVNEFVVLYSARIELCADKILAGASDPATRKNALLWKINGISACFQAASRPDPLGAYLDIWILNRQMIHLFDSPAGGELLGPWQVVVSEECHSLDQRLQHIDQVLGGELRLGRDFVAAFAADFPLSNLYFDREPIASRYIEEVEAPVRELYQVLANLDENVDELKKLTILHAQHIPKLARWEAQLLLLDTTQLATVQRPLEDFSLTAEAVSRVAHITETVPELLQRERHALHEIVSDERRDTLLALDGMRQETVQQLESERAIVLDAIRQERHEVMDALHDERQALSQELSADVSRALEASDSILQRRLSELAQQAPRVIDHFFWRLCQMGIILMLILAAVVWRIYPKLSQSSAVRPTLTVSEEIDAPILAAGSRNERTKAA
jgi:hypothetical protein